MASHHRVSLEAVQLEEIERFFNQPIGPDTRIVAVRFRVLEQL